MLCFSRVLSRAEPKAEGSYLGSPRVLARPRGPGCPVHWSPSSLPHGGSPRPGRKVPLSRKTWGLWPHTSEGLIDRATLSQGHWLRSPDLLGPWPLGTRTYQVVVTPSSAFPSGLLTPGPLSLQSLGHLKVSFHGAQLHGASYDSPAWVGLGLKPPSLSSLKAVAFLIFIFFGPAFCCRLPWEGGSEGPPTCHRAGL